MKINLKIIFVVIIVFAVSLSVWSNLQKKGTQECGGTALEKYLVTDCPWSAIPWLQDIKFSDGYTCFLDIWLSESKPEGSFPEVCRGGDNAREPSTSRCLLEGITSFDLWREINGRRVTLVGDYKKIKVCHAFAKCSEPECSKCEEESVFVPCEVMEK